MQTPLNSSETKAVISETLERDPSFLPPPVTKQPHVPSRDTRNKSLRGRGEQKKQKKKKEKKKEKKKKKKASKEPGCNSSFRRTLEALLFLKPQSSGKRPPLRADLGAQGSPVTTPQEGILPSPRQPGARPAAHRHQRLGSRSSSSSLPRLPLHNRSPPPPHAPQRLGPAGGRLGGRGQGGFAAARSLPGLLPPRTIVAARLSAAAAARTPPRRRLSPTVRGGAGSPPASRPLPRRTGAARSRRPWLRCALAPQQGGGGNHRSAGRPPARLREEPAGDGTTQARTVRRPRPAGHSAASWRQGSRSHAPAGPTRPSPRPLERGDCTNSSPSPPPRRQPPAGRAGSAGRRAGQRVSAWSPAPAAAASRSAEPPPTRAPLSRER
ncbi:serine/arginine repetitive matrix protein 1-like [Oenanthe melanoleuca]|uniref:serine/arginine repetitive matrix protein 1-like n=1 Tax=Oenanthe melanoleuca TaxID=2939378 RepID=UPI0024C16C2A|nr:serine/arginine repetitive matrix protein 1-like [Oenanthe melanoleuca]